MDSFDQKSLTWDDDPDKVERAKIVAAEINRHLVLSNEMTGFEYGCGTGLLSFNLQPQLKKITLADNSEGMLSVLTRKIKQNDLANMFPMKIDLLEDALPNEKYDLIYTLMALHHVVETGKILKIFHSLLKLGGYLCIADLEEEDGSFHEEGFIGHNGFNRVDLTNTLEDCGFSNVHSHICYTKVKTTKQGKRSFPIFLMIAQKDNSLGVSQL